MQIAVLGMDLGKTSCSLVGWSAGRVVMRRWMHREKVVTRFAADLAPCVVAMEACCGAHHLGRTLRDFGDEIRLMPSEYVRPYVRCRGDRGGCHTPCDALCRVGPRSSSTCSPLETVCAVALRTALLFTPPAVGAAAPPDGKLRSCRAPPKSSSAGASARSSA